MTRIIANRYELQDLVVQQVHSHFYKAWDKQKSRGVLIRLHDLSTAGIEEKLKNHMEFEIAVLGKLNHPNILEVSDYGLEGSIYYLVYACHDFQMLHQVLEEAGKFPLETALQYTLEMADVLAHLHHIEIIHCDVSPGNVMIVEGKLKLLGFSIANHRMWREKMSTGTPPYMSPEALRGALPADERDIWALGVSLYEMISGKRPYYMYEGDGSAEAMQALIPKIVYEPVPDIRSLEADLPPRLIALLNWMLEKDPKQRVNRMRLVAAELEEILAGLRQKEGFATGDVLDSRYRVQSVINEGSFGKVFRAADLQTGDSVALKELKPELAKDPQQLRRFQREAEMLRQLNHPNIIKVLGSFDLKEKHYIAMEYVAGGDLRNLIGKRRLTIQVTLKIALELADALARAHHLHIIHRDIKPENILLTDSLSPRLGDFGIARMVEAEALTEAGVFLGTLYYVAPEVVKGEAVTAKADVWSFGLLLYEMLTGKHPFKRDTPKHLVMMILEEAIPRLDEVYTDCPASLVELVGAMLEREPANRLDSMREIGSRLEQILKGM
jgi:serine/threonine protein kinase